MNRHLSTSPLENSHSMMNVRVALTQIKTHVINFELMFGCRRTSLFQVNKRNKKCKHTAYNTYALYFSLVSMLVTSLRIINHVN